MSSENNSTKSREQRLNDEAQFFQAPWSEPTEKARLQLLLVALVGILMGAVGIFPKEISALGLKIEDINQRALLICWAVVDCYLLVTLIFHSYSDFVRGYWRELWKLERLDLPQDDMMKELALHRIKLRGKLQTLHGIRLILDVLIPVLAGISAFVFLVWRSCKI